jgi:hypothetical protein
MDLDTATNAVRGLLETYLAARSFSKIIHDNEPNQDPPGAKSLWCRVSVIVGDSIQVGFGSGAGPDVRTPAIAAVQIFGPYGSGTATIESEAAALKNHLVALSSGGVRFTVPRVRTPGRSGAFWVVNVESPFFFDSQP